MNAEELKHELIGIFGSQLTFNKEFDEYADKLKNIDKSLLEWCKLLKKMKIKPIISSKLKDSIIFIKKIGSSNRCIVIKIKNGEFKEVHLGDHAYYDKLRNFLGLKKGSEYY